VPDALDQGALRRQWQALVKQGNAEAAHQARSLRAGLWTAIRRVAPA